MGRPGGFFKKLKAKQKRAASRTQRGTKGASKEDRRRKHNERVEVYAAKREAEQLADVSSSSEDEPSTDSEAEERQENKSLWKLRELLGVTPAASASAAGTVASSGSRKRLRRPSAAAPHHDHHGDRHHSDDNGDDDDDDEWNSSDSEAAARLVSRRPPPQKQGKQTAARHNGDGGATSSAALDRDDDSEMDAEDWRLYLGDDSSDSGEEGLEGDEGDEEAELGEETDDADDVVDEDLLMGIDSDDEEEENDEEGDDEEGDDAEGSEGGAVNPLFGLDDDDDDDDDGADLFDSGMLYDGEGDEEDDEAEAEDEEGSEDEEEKEDAFVDDEGSISMSSSDEEEKGEDGGVTTGAGKKKSPATPSTTAESAEQRQLLQSFQFNTSSVSVLQRHSDGVLSEADAWVQKYHLDQHGLVDSTPLKPVPIPHTALEALATSNAPLQQRAEAVMQETQDKKELGIFFVSAEEYATLHPENVAVLASEHATQHLLHAPFDSPSNSPATAAAAAAVRCPAYLHPALWVKWEAFRASKRMPCFTVEERGLLDLLQGYPDVFDTLQCWQNSESRREIHALHILNHWFKARSVVVAHDAILAKHKQARRARRRQQWALQKQQQQNEEEGEEEDKMGKNSPSKNAKNDGRKGKKQPKQEKKKTNTKTEEAASAPAEPELDEELELRDRGFSKTRLCVLCPLRNHAYKFVYTLVSILQADPEKCPKLAMFEQDFTEIEEALDPTFKRRPRDYQRAFEGNIDDSFCVGLRLEPDRVHLYAHPLNSDLLICSPLGLRRRMEKNGDVLVSLSSIEVCVVEEAQMLYQQNWMHVTAVLEALNKRPTDTTHGLSDLRRVYSWALEGKSGRHRQTIVTSEVSNATMLSTFRTASVNNSGKVMLQRRADPGVLSRVLVPVRQHFIRFEPTSLSTVDDDRFDYFTKQMYATKINAMAERDVRIIVFVPSYFDFVRVRNYLHREYRESYAAISEYTSLKQQRKALGQFSDLERPVLLVTERFYFFKRYFVKMAEALVFYSPPMFPEYYASLTNRLVATSPNAFTMTLYCRYDTHELNRLVGTSRMVQLLERESGVFSFVTS